MNILKFTIDGNQEDPEGNPLAYHRSTQAGQWKPATRRYNAWKQYVISEFYNTYPKLIPRAANNLLRLLKPLSTSKEGKVIMNLKIHWCSNLHGDPDNIFKGIADALFDNDKYLVGSFDYVTDPKRPGRVEVELIFTGCA